MSRESELPYSTKAGLFFLATTLAEKLFLCTQQMRLNYGIKWTLLNNLDGVKNHFKTNTKFNFNL